MLKSIISFKFGKNILMKNAKRYIGVLVVAAIFGLRLHFAAEERKEKQQQQQMIEELSRQDFSKPKKIEINDILDTDIIEESQKRLEEATAKLDSIKISMEDLKPIALPE